MTDNPEPLGFSYSYRDLLLALVMCFMAMAVLALAARETSHQHAPTAAGDLTVTLHWDNRVAADVDLWVRAPGSRAVGFAHRDGKYCDLTRDDLGHGHDPIGLNLEQVVCRNAAPGEYVVNAMLYASWDGHLPVRATLWVTDRHGAVLVKQSVRLRFEGAENTAMRFVLQR
ncbi:MAG: hypothetical protein KGL35_01250, partial [Bradyrhizobium sp.]|nr:hypothetical protein [Bradyrhizobium sp.]